MAEPPSAGKPRLRTLLDATQAFVRVTFFGFTSMLVLLGAGTVNPDPSAASIVMLIVVAANFHCFGYVHNDVVDLAIDRTAPARVRDPLVSGAISPETALTFAWAQIPISFVAAYLGGAPWPAHAILTLGYLAAIAYNHFGKRCPIPMVTDAIQGVAWISIALFGALSMGDANGMSLLVAAFGFGFIFLINGVHGGLRDLRNDLAHGQITTAIYFGARPIGPSAVNSTPALQRFAALPLLIMIAPTGAMLLSGGPGYDAATRLTVLLGFTAVSAVAVWLFWQAVRSEQPDRRRRRAIYGNAFFLLLGPLVAFVPMLGNGLQIAVLACFFGPLLLFQDRIAEVRSLLAARRSA